MSDLTDADKLTHTFPVLSGVQTKCLPHEYVPDACPYRLTQTNHVTEFDFDAHTDVLTRIRLQAVAKLYAGFQADFLNRVSAPTV